jgi:hypothetical protein
LLFPVAYATVDQRHLDTDAFSDDERQQQQSGSAAADDWDVIDSVASDTYTNPRVFTTLSEELFPSLIAKLEEVNDFVLLCDGEDWDIHSLDYSFPSLLSYSDVVKSNGTECNTMPTTKTIIPITIIPTACKAKVPRKYGTANCMDAESIYEGIKASRGGQSMLPWSRQG